MAAVAKARHNRTLPIKTKVSTTAASSPVKPQKKGKIHWNPVRNPQKRGETHWNPVKNPRKGKVHWNQRELGQAGQAGQAGVIIVVDDAASGDVTVLYCVRHLSDTSSSNCDGT